MFADAALFFTGLRPFAIAVALRARAGETTDFNIVKKSFARSSVSARTKAERKRSD